MPVMYRISKDYTNFLLQSLNVSEIVNSIINIPWICLQSNNRFYESKNNQAGPFKSEASFPFFNMDQRENKRNSIGNNSSLEYFLEIDIAHPISDKVYYSIAYSSVLGQKEPILRNQNEKELSDTYFIGEARKCFIDRKEIIIPDVAFVLHIKMMIPDLNRVKQFTCIVYSMHEQNYDSQGYLKQGPGEYTMTIQMDDECLLTFYFSSFFVTTKTETGVAALNSLYPWESKQFLDSLNMHRLILTHSKCKVSLYEKQARPHALSEIYNDLYMDANAHRYQSVADSRHQSLAADSLHDFSSDRYSSAKQLASKQGKQTTRSKSSGKDSDQPFFSEKEYNQFNEQKESEEDSFQKKDSAPILGNHSFEQILKDISLLKHYANSSQRGRLVQEVILKMSEEDFNNSFSYLKQTLRDICKSKFGNYIIQTFAQNLPKSRLNELLCLVDPSNQIKPYVIEIICHPKGTFAVQGIITALKEKENQKIFLDMILEDLNQLVKNKEGSYIVKEIYRNFNKDLLEEVAKVFMKDLGNNITDKFAICIFKEVTYIMASSPNQLDQLLITFSSHYQAFKTNTFYHFGLQYFLEVKYF